MIYFVLHIQVFCVRICTCSTCMPGDHKGQKRASDLPEHKLQTMKSCYVGAGI